MAGVASNLSFFLRKLGLECKVIAKGTNPFGYGDDHYPLWKTLLPLMYFLTYDVIHYHSNTWLRRRRLKHLDYYLAKQFRRKTIFHFHGSDLRVGHMNQELHKIIDHLKIVLVSTPDLLDFFPSEKGVWLPNPINVEMWYRKPRVRITEKLVVGYYNPPWHAYSERIYCAERIKSAIGNLKRKGVNVEGKPVYGKLHMEMPSYYSSIDVFVDKLGVGWYSLSCCEAMASGLPVITYVREDLRRFLKGIEPFLISSKENLEENLEKVLSDEGLRKQLIQRGKKYVLDIHDGLKVAKSLVKIYQQA